MQHRYQKGESGNLSGKPKGRLSDKTIEKLRAKSAMALLDGLISDQTADPLHRIQAAAVILENNRATSEAA